MSDARGLDILYILPFPPHRGGSRVVGEYVLNGLSALGHRVRALAPIARTGVESFPLNCPQIKVIRFRVPYFEGSGAAGPTGARRDAIEAAAVGKMLPGLIASDPPEILLVGHESVARFISNPPGRPFSSVVIIHGGATLDALTRGQRGSASLIRRLKSFDLVVAVSEHMACGLRRLGLRNVSAIRNPIDLEDFRPAPEDPGLRKELGIAGNAVVVLHASRMRPEKRPLDLVESAMKALRKDPRLFYVMAGGGSGRRAMGEACRRAGVWARFKFPGWVDRGSLPRYMNLADIVVTASESEGQPMVCLEAQACGRVVVASDIPAHREIIEDRKTGILFRKGNTDDLTAKMLFVASNPERRAAIGRNARAAVQYHALDRVVAEYSAALSAAFQRRRETARNRAADPAQ